MPHGPNSTAQSSGDLFPRPSGDLFDAQAGAVHWNEPIVPGAWLLRGFCAGEAAALLGHIAAVEACSPFRRMTTRRGGSLSVAMTNCGALGWVSDASGYRYDATDPANGKPWPPMPPAFSDLASRASVACGFAPLAPDACLVNRYGAGTQLSLHQDRDELDVSAPIVSVSLGLPAVFLFGGPRRADRPRRLRVENGDVAVWGGPARLAFHGVAPLRPGIHPLSGEFRFNLTFRTTGLNASFIAAGAG